jgi:pyruvate,orthophosphate dikinase
MENWIMAGKIDKLVYLFGGGNNEGDASMRALLGGKGANLADMASLGLPVPRPLL